MESILSQEDNEEYDEENETSGIFESSYLESISIEDSDTETSKRNYRKINKNLVLLQ